ncbi:MAG: isoprenylcysteine carboxylmethyltransferase family protein [Bacteroidales bacterium]
MKTSALLFRSLAGIATVFVLLFLSAGRFDYWQGWLYSVFSILMILMNYLAMKGNPELISERFKPGKGMKWWDKWFFRLSAPVYFAMLIVAGLDSGRFQWSPAFDPEIYVAGAALSLLGQGIFTLAKRQNHYFSSVVRIQTERGHIVCDTGLYRIVRHPGYMGSILSNLGLPLLLGSMWCFIPTIFSIILILIRTWLEDQTLKAELAGYIEYSDKTRFRILPFIW